MIDSPCFKCNGSGQVSFKHIANGVCFQCGGTGKLSIRKSDNEFKYQDKPGFPVLTESQQCTTKQWEYLLKLVDDSDTNFRKILKQAGCPHATKVYVSKAMMSRAIEIAKMAQA